MDETKPTTTTTKLAGLLGYSYQGMRKKLTHNYAPFTMGEFETLCNFFHKNSAAEWMKILRVVALKNNRLNEAKIIDDMLNDHTIKNEIVNLAITYLHPTALTDDLNDPAIMAEVAEARKRGHEREARND
ncbi:hypothetical protein [Bifidobacterium fermentum]|uniref:Uncharacterized protein n=1 Tax=Bifidobacterium fermentum TaxID=3059035 RepID=A0AB39UF82_9BIFI